MLNIHKKLSKILYAFLILFLLLTFNSNSALAADANFPQDTTVALTISGSTINFTIIGGSTADSVTTNTGNLQVTMSSGQTFTFRSDDKYWLENTLSNSLIRCENSYSQIALTVTETKTITITPEADCGKPGRGGGGGGGGGGVALSGPTPTPVPSATPAPTGTRPSPAQYGLKEGDVVGASASGDPDIYIINQHGYKRLFLNPIIFSFYGHLGGFSKVKRVDLNIRDVFQTSGLFRNCETNDPKVYGVEITGEDTGALRWVNTSGAQAVADDPDFFKKIFCINSNEFNWYKQGTPFTSVKQIPAYSRKTVVSTPASSVATTGKLIVVSSITYLNVRDQASIKGKLIGKVLPNQQFNFVDVKDGWYKIQKDGKDLGWVFGKYVTKM